MNFGKLNKKQNDWHEIWDETWDEIWDEIWGRNQSKLERLEL